MNIETKQIMHSTSSRYPYDYRVEVLGDPGDPLSDDKVSDWLEENDIPYTQTGYGVYYMKEQHVAMLLLRWS
jgi:hypothetical protein